MHSRGDGRIPVSNAEILFRELGSVDKRLSLLDYPCHVITKGEDRKRVETEIHQFIRKNARNPGERNRP
jgi:esterase/lipase